MKIIKIIGLLIGLCFIPLAYCDTANIAIRVNGSLHDNRYFLCIPNIGCLSILAGAEGKVYPVENSFTMHPIFIKNLQNFSTSGVGFPASCNVNVDTGKTIYIYGTIVNTRKGATISGLHCELR